MPDLLEGLVAIVTGAGRGIGGEHALALARHGAAVVVNDLGAELHGGGRSSEPAESVVEQIRSAGGRAIANADDIAEPEGAQGILCAALGEFGDVHALINNAGILRNRMLVNMTVDDFDAVIRVHLRGAFCMAQPLAAYWRQRRNDGLDVFGRIINTTSPTGLYGNVGQTNYAAAKAGIAMMTMVWASELGRYGDITVNAISPAARTRMTEKVLGPQAGDGGWNPNDPANVPPLAVWLASREAATVTGRVFNVYGGHLSLAEPWRRGPSSERSGVWDPTEMGSVVESLLEGSVRIDPMGRVISEVGQ